MTSRHDVIAKELANREDIQAERAKDPRLDLCDGVAPIGCASSYLHEHPKKSQILAEVEKFHDGKHDAEPLANLLNVDPGFIPNFVNAVVIDDMTTSLINRRES